MGCLAAVIRCGHLEVLTFSHTSVVKEFFSQVRALVREKDEDSGKRVEYSLKTLFLPVTNGADFQEIIRAFPNLEDLRLWTTVTQLR